MLFATKILWIWVFTTAPVAILAQQLRTDPDPLLMTSRLDRLESLLADHQAQFQRERDRWEKEKQILRENLHLLQGDVHALQREKQEMRREMEALHHTQALVVAENQGMKAELGDLQRLLASVNRKQQSLQDVITKCATKQRPVGGGENREEDEQTPEGRTGQAVQTSKHIQDLRKEKDPSPQHSRDPSHDEGDPDPVQPWRRNTDPAQPRRDSRDPEPLPHVRVVRSDDHGPLEAVTSHLAQQMAGVTADIQALKASDAQQRHDIQAAGGSTFVQWGSSTCEGSSELVYLGVMGGSYYTNTGAAANALCLSMSPALKNTAPNVPYTLLYGGEYETHDSNHNMDPVCAVCRSPNPTTIMVPGTNVCSEGWTLQYSGFLMAGLYSYNAATQFICVDVKLESVVGSSRNSEGYLLYFTKTQCGSLPCGPYQDGKVVTCAVCSK